MTAPRFGSADEQVTVQALRWPYALGATFLGAIILLPVIVALSIPSSPKLDSGDIFALSAILAPLTAVWLVLFVLPVIRPRRLIFTTSAVTLDTFWRRQQWSWESVEGMWPLGGYKPQIVIVVGNSRKRIFLGAYWPGDTKSLERTLADSKGKLKQAKI